VSRTQDDYAPDLKNLSEPVLANNTEPADPDTPDHSARRSVPLAPDSVKRDRMPDPFLTDNGRVLTVGEAGETYLKIQRTNWKNDQLTSKYERHLHNLYPRLLEADRHFQAEYDGLTTVMLTRRLSPLDEFGGYLTPWECNEMLHGGGVHQSLNQAISYQLGDSFRYEWVGVTSPTKTAGTPHEHLYFWIEDPADKITTQHFSTGLDKHIKYCTNAYEQDHTYRVDGTDGALTFQHNPQRCELSPDGFWNVREVSQTYAATGQVRDNTTGAQYLASQLAHLPVADFYNSNHDYPPTALLEGAAMAWASPYNWFRASGGVPALDAG